MYIVNMIGILHNYAAKAHTTSIREKQGWGTLLNRYGSGSNAYTKWSVETPNALHKIGSTLYEQMHTQVKQEYDERVPTLGLGDKFWVWLWKITI